MKSPKLRILNIITEAANAVSSKVGLTRIFRDRLYANAIYLMLNTAVMASLGFFFWMVVARFYTEVDVGYGSAIISIISLLAMLSLVGLNSSLIRFLPQADEPNRLINASFTVGGLISIAAGGIFLAGLNLWSPALTFITQNVIFSSAFMAFLLAWTLSSMIEAAFLAGRRTEFVLLKNTILSLVKIPLPIILILYFHTFGIVASWGLAIGVALFFSFFLFLPRVHNKYKPLPTLKLNLIKDMSRYSGGNYLANLLQGGPTYIFPVMVVNLLGAEQNAYFYIAWMIACLLFTIPLAVSQSLFAEGSHFEDRLRENARKSIKFHFLLSIPAVVVIGAIGKWLLLAFGPSYSANALKLLWVLCLSSLPLGITHIYTIILRVTGRLRELILICGLTAAAVLLVSYFILPSSGIIGVGYVHLGAQMIVAIYIISSRGLYSHKGGQQKWPSL